MSPLATPKYDFNFYSIFDAIAFEGMKIACFTQHPAFFVHTVFDLPKLLQAFRSLLTGTHFIIIKLNEIVVQCFLNSNNVLGVHCIKNLHLVSPLSIVGLFYSIATKLTCFRSMKQSQICSLSLHMWFCLARLLGEEMLNYS